MAPYHVWRQFCTEPERHIDALFYKFHESVAVMRHRRPRIVELAPWRQFMPL
jgi:hypothetical protein